MKEAYVSYETAKLLKEKGFKCITMFSYSNRGTTMCGHWENEIDWVPKCTHQMAMAWLREVHNIDICVFPYQNDYISYSYEVKIYKNKEMCFSITGSKTYEEAVEIALKYTLNKL